MAIAVDDRCMPVVDQQLTIAGVRLAAVLNVIFADTKALPATAPASEPARQVKFVGSRGE